jgi:hypothetical protein
MRHLIAVGCAAWLLAACSSVPNGQKPGAATITPQVTVEAPATPQQPKTLEAATAASQEDANRFSSGDYAGDWEMGAKQVHDGISKADYITLHETCKGDPGLPITVTGVRLDGTDKAVVRWEINVFGGIKKARRWFMKTVNGCGHPPTILLRSSASRSTRSSPMRKPAGAAPAPTKSP